MLTLSVNGEALRRLENVPVGEGAEAWRRLYKALRDETSKSVAPNASSDTNLRLRRSGTRHRSNRAV